jgi:hypothetical protein
LEREFQTGKFTVKNGLCVALETYLVEVVEVVVFFVFPFLLFFFKDLKDQFLGVELSNFLT